MTSPAQVPGSGRTFVAGFGLLTSWTEQSRSRLLFLLPFLAIPFVFAGCGSKAVDAGPQPYERVSPIEDEDRLYRDDAATLPDTMRWIIRDESSLSEVWTQATQSMDDPPPLPTIDFARHMVIVVGAGRCHPGDQIQVESYGRERVYDPGDLTRTMERSFATVRTTVEENPFPGESFPIEIVRIPVSDLPFQFREEGQMCRGS